MASAALLYGCAAIKAAAPSKAPPPRPVVIVETAPAWQQAATPADINRLDRIGLAWAEALQSAAKGGFRRAVASEGKLLEPRAALARAAPAPGSYMCRLIQFGAPSRRGGGYSASKPAFCYIGVDEQDKLWLARQTGERRRDGYLWEDSNSRRMIFLGSLASGAGKAGAPYSTDPKTDIAGIFERIGPLRYRLVTPWPAGGMKLEVLELVPAAVQPEE